jgi:superfamily II DNA/RNA helicase
MGAITMNFEDLKLAPAILKAVREQGYENPTAIQAQAIPLVLEGHDLLGGAQTGTGKTAAFTLPMLHNLSMRRSVQNKWGGNGIRALVLTPTRELAAQVEESVRAYGKYLQLSSTVIFGGVGMNPQIDRVKKGVDILVATPGRLLDLQQQGFMDLSQVQMLVLDEADRMLDMGFIDDITTIADHVPAARQTVMYSATFAGNVGNLARNLLREPQRIDVASHTDTHVNIEQRLHWADNTHHKNALLDHILTGTDLEQAVIFTSTQRDADWLADRLAELGHAVASLHGGMPQGRRNRVLQGLRNKHLRVLVATDVAARGIDVPTISHVINYGLPMKAEDYVHRIGRTGRAGRSGLAVTLAERRDAAMVQRIQRFTTQRIPPAVIAGLEPKRPEPSQAPRPAAGPRKAGGFGHGRPGFKPAGKPFGGKPFAGKRAAGKPGERAR